MKKRIINSNFSFDKLPAIKRPRTRFPITYDIKTSANIGELVPYDITEVYAGDTWTMQDTFVCRGTSAFLRPVMDNIFVEMHHFFVPLRLCDDKFKDIVAGGEEPNEWSEPVPSYVPQVSGMVYENTVGDYLGLPTGGNIQAGVSVYPFRAFARIYNDWWRDENVQHSVLVYTDNQTHTNERFNNQPWSSSNYFGKLPKVGKMKDYFTSALPAPQKGLAVPAFNFGDLPLQTLDKISLFGGVPEMQMNYYSGNHYVTLGGQLSDSLTNSYSLKAWNGDAGIEQQEVVGSNLGVKGGAADFTVNDLRLAFQMQKILERSARGGTRYTEYLLSAFGVQAPDASLQRSEYLGGKRIPLNQSQVAQTSQATEDSPLGSLASFSHTSGASGYSKGFTEHGYIISCLVLRYHHTYQQGIEPFWRRRERFDFYDPAFQNIGEQPIYTTELFGYADPDRVFGYKEAYAELRYKPSKVTGAMRTNSTTSFDIYHFADWYANAPVLSSQFIEENADFVDRTLAVPSTSEPAFLFDIYCAGSAIRVLPPYSVPSLIDHN